MKTKLTFFLFFMCFSKAIETWNVPVVVTENLVLKFLNLGNFHLSGLFIPKILSCGKLFITYLTGIFNLWCWLLHILFGTILLMLLSVQSFLFWPPSPILFSASPLISIVLATVLGILNTWLSYHNNLQDTWMSVLSH